MDTRKCVYLCLRESDVVIWTVSLLGWSTLGVSPNNTLRWRLRQDYMAQNRSVLHWKYTRRTQYLFPAGRLTALKGRVCTTFVAHPCINPTLKDFTLQGFECCCVFSAMLLKQVKGWNKVGGQRIQMLLKPWTRITVINHCWQPIRECMSISFL